MSNLISDSNAQATVASALERIAASLGCTTDIFTGPVPHDLTETMELLSLWLTTENRQTRARAQVMLRSAANKAPVRTEAPAEAVQERDRGPQM